MAAPRQVRVTEQAAADIERLREDDPQLAARAQALVQLLEEGKIQGRPLRHLASYGDLSDCRKLYFGRGGSDATHRMVYRLSTAGAIEVLEVVAIEAREDGYVYLLAAHRRA